MWRKRIESAMLTGLFFLSVFCQEGISEDANHDEDFVEIFSNGYQLLSSSYYSSQNYEAAGYSDDDTPSLSSPTVNTTSGMVMGTTFPDSHSFYEIPYAQPPIGKMRFAEPQPAEWTDRTIDATKSDGLSCQQKYNDCNDGVCETNLSENCLVLDVSVPSTVNLGDPNSPASDLPVLFWIYGGFFYAGTATSPQTNGRWLSNATNTIVVAINYRVDAFGFLYYDDGTDVIMGNQGLKDQQLALQWVQDNIERFGGDKNKITIFGQSAGAQSVMLHLVSSKSKPLFKRAIMESNPAIIQYLNFYDASVITEDLMDIVNCSDHTIECLRNTKATEIVNARNTVIARAANRSDAYSAIEPYRPLIDGSEFTDQPMTLIQRGSWNTDKEVIIGTNSQEMIWIKALLENANETLGRAGFERGNVFLLGKDIATNVSGTYMKLGCDDSIYNSSRDRCDYNDLFSIELTDMFFACPNRALARFMSAVSQNIFLYNNTYPMTGPGCKAVMNLKQVCGYAFHESEIVFVFRSGPSYGMTFTANDTKIANTFSEYWGNFAYYGNPSASNSDNSAFPSWPHLSYTGTDTESAGDVNIVIAYPNSFEETKYREDICNYWDELNVYPSEVITPPSSAETTTSPTTSGGKGLIMESCVNLYFMLLLVALMFRSY